MPIVHDIVLADLGKRDRVLNSARHRQYYRCMDDGGVSIDDVVTAICLHRGVVEDRKQFFAVRREVYSSYVEHDQDSQCNVALLSTVIRDEMAALADNELARLVRDWPADESNSGALALSSLVAACREAQDGGFAVMIKAYESENAFETALRDVPKDERKELQAAYESWDAVTRLEADHKLKFLRQIGQTDCAGIVQEEIDHGLPHCASLSFLSALQRTVEAAIQQGIDGVDYIDDMDTATESAIAKFRDSLDDGEQARILRAFAITLMSEIVDVAEQGYAFGIPSGPTAWALAETDHQGKPTGRFLGELHAHLDGDDQFWPKVDG